MGAGCRFAVWLYRIARKRDRGRMEAFIESRSTNRRRWTISINRNWPDIERRAVSVSTGKQPS